MAGTGADVKPKAPAIRDRIRELRRVRAGDLVPHPKNWRLHTDAQRSALDGVLREVGFADALLARELPDGRLGLVDGHLRAARDPDALVPVLVCDLTDAEADLVLATLDPLAALAQRDDDAYRALTEGLANANADVQRLLEATAGDVPDESGAIKAITIPPAQTFVWLLVGVPMDQADRLLAMAADARAFATVIETSVVADVTTRDGG